MAFPQPAAGGGDGRDFPASYPHVSPDDVTSGGCALLSLLACQSSCAEYASDPTVAHLGAALGDQHAARALGAHVPQPVPPDPVSVPLGGGDPSSEWIIERRGLHLTEPWSSLPKSIRPKAKLPQFLRAGWKVLELIRERGLHEFQWLVQDNHIVSSSRCPQTYIYTHDTSRSGRKRPLVPGGITITTEGGGHFWTENGASGAAAKGTEGVFACSARDAHGELLLGKCFRRARLVRDVADRSVRAQRCAALPCLRRSPARPRAAPAQHAPRRRSPPLSPPCRPRLSRHAALSRGAAARAGAGPPAAGEEGGRRLRRQLLLPPPRRA